MCHVLTDQENSELQNPDREILTKEHYGYLEKTPYNTEEAVTDPSKLIWIGTIFLKLECDLRKKDAGTFYGLKDLKFSDYPAKFNIVLRRSWTDIFIDLSRKSTSLNYMRMGTHFLRFFLEISNSLNPGKYTDMPVNKNGTSVQFLLKELYDLDESCDSIVVKCSIWKYEQLSVVNDASVSQEKKFLAHILDDELRTESTYGDMSYLMDRDHMNGIFTGGESKEFSNRKLLLLKRTFVFSDELARRLTCLRENIPFENATPVSSILGYIYNGVSHPIQNRECLELLKMSCMYGLRYLQRECTLFLVHNLDDYAFLVDVMIETSKLEQWTLLDPAVDHFIRHKEKVVACDRWIELMTFRPEQVRILDSLRRRRIATL